MHWGRSTTSAVAAATVLVIGLSAWGIAAIPDGDGVVHGCVDRSGDVRIVDPDASGRLARECRSSETAVDWNQRGQQGEPGDRGPVGPEGPAARSVCKAEDLLLCLPEGADLRPRLTGEGWQIDGESYRVELENELEKYLEAGEHGAELTRLIVKASTASIVVVADLDEAAGDLLAWNAQAVAGAPLARRDVQLELRDGGDTVWTGHLVNALPRSVKLDGSRVQVVLQAEAVVPAG